MSTPDTHPSLLSMAVPDHEPGPDDCPNFTRYIPFGGSMVTVECVEPVGHDQGPDATAHRGTYLVPGEETEVEFSWIPPSADELVNHDPVPE